MENLFNNSEFNNVTHGRGYVYSLKYHIVWCTKYRKPVLVDEIADTCKTMMYQMAEEYKFKILAIEVMPDHIHLLLSCKPQFFISDMIKIFKGNLARRLFLDYPKLKDSLWGGHLWNPSYFVATVSERTENQITEYINSQKKR